MRWNGSFTFKGSNPLNLGSGSVLLAPSTGTNITVTLNGSNPLTVGGAIGDFGIGYSLTVAGPGTLSLAGNSSYSGGTFLTSGQLNINSSSAIGTGLLTISAGAAISNTSGRPGYARDE